jgi:hypothetical protein
MVARIKINRDQVVSIVEAIHHALENGHPPPGEIVIGDNTLKGVIRVVADRLGLAYSTVAYRVGAPGVPGAIFREHGIAIDWTRYKPHPAPVAMPTPQIAPSDRRFTLLQDEVRDLRNQLKEAHRASST